MGPHTPVSIYLFFHFFNFFLIDKMFFFLIIASFIATIDCKSSLAKGPLGPSPSLKTKSIFKSPGMQGGLNGWNGPEDHRQADEEENVLKGCDRPCPKIYMPICDSNKITHNNKCLFKIAQCEAKQEGKSLTYAHRGSCKKSLSLPGCDRPCPKIYMPICDSNKITHNNKCLFKIAQCEAKQEGKSLTYAHRGSCKKRLSGWSPYVKASAPVESDCKKARAEAKIKRSNGGWMFHIPSCLSDGTYDPTQCHSLTSMCWCVKADGTVIEETYVFLTPLDCEEFKDGLPWWWD